MPRYRVTLEYDGTPFVGWQVQAVGVSVQGRLAEAIYRLTGERVAVYGAGRTDAGVHALGQVAHFDLARAWPAATVRAAVNFHLKPEPVAILDCSLAADGFDARRSALARHYRYRIRAHRAAHPRSQPGLVGAAGVAGGTHGGGRPGAGRPSRLHNLSCRRMPSQVFVKTLDRLELRRVGEEIHIEASARSFLHNQVRSMVGSLKLVGEGKWTPADLATALSARNRSACGPVAPAQGLYLVRVDYGYLTAGGAAGLEPRHTAAEELVSDQQ